jgi:hypothetical protein
MRPVQLLLKNKCFALSKTTQHPNLNFSGSTYQMKGRRVKVKNSSSFKTCVPCVLKQAPAKKIDYKTKDEQANEKMQAVKEAQEWNKMNGCCASRAIDLECWFTHCEG